MTDVVISSVQDTPTRSGLNFSWSEPCCIHLMVGGGDLGVANYSHSIINQALDAA